MDLPEIPESMIIIGSRKVGLEQAQLFPDLGTRVTIIGRLAPTAEPEMTAIVRQTLTHDGITVIEEHATGVTHEQDQIHVATASGRSLCAERLLVATGRRPSTEHLNLPAAG